MIRGDGNTQLLGFFLEKFNGDLDLDPLIIFFKGKLVFKLEFIRIMYLFSVESINDWDE